MNSPKTKSRLIDLEATQLAAKYLESENSQRTLGDVVFNDLNQLQASINGPIRPLHKNDNDQTFGLISGHHLGDVKKPELLSQLDMIKNDEVKIGQEYQLLENLFEKVRDSLDHDKTMHDDRDRYSDILTYSKSAVKL